MTATLNFTVQFILTFIMLALSGIAGLILLICLAIVALVYSIFVPEWSSAKMQGERKVL